MLVALFKVAIWATKLLPGMLLGPLINIIGLGLTSCFWYFCHK